VGALLTYSRSKLQSKHKTFHKAAKMKQNCRAMINIFGHALNKIDRKGPHLTDGETNEDLKIENFY
jgi:hypothetical protein